MADGGQAGLLDLEKELTCSEWFSWQATQASTYKPNPISCPSCRASVRETRPNATVTTLLDMYLQANPGRGRGQKDRDELKQKYKPGEQVVPRITIRNDDPDDERMLAAVRELSLREVGVREPGSYERGTRHRTTERWRDQSDDGRHRSRQLQPGLTPQISSDAGAHRQIGHQSSLRSLMSNSEIGSSEMEEEILRLVDEGWLDGIDLNNLDTSQVDELSERIADAYRRRHGHRSRPGNIKRNFRAASSLITPARVKIASSRSISNASKSPSSGIKRTKKANLTITPDIRWRNTFWEPKPSFSISDRSVGETVKLSSSLAACQINQPKSKDYRSRSSPSRWAQS
ncbi:MAG: hypothetical protein Q9181_003025 [Wetmoreana brouardii]